MATEHRAWHRAVLLLEQQAAQQVAPVGAIDDAQLTLARLYDTLNETDAHAAVWARRAKC